MNADEPQLVGRVREILLDRPAADPAAVALSRTDDPRGARLVLAGRAFPRDWGPEGVLDWLSVQHNAEDAEYWCMTFDTREEALERTLIDRHEWQPDRIIDLRSGEAWRVVHPCRGRGGTGRGPAASRHRLGRNACGLSKLHGRAFSCKGGV